MGYAALVIKYWPAIVAGLYLAYTAASFVGGDKTANVAAAFAAFLAAAGLNHIGAAAHTKVDALKQ